ARLEQLRCREREDLLLFAFVIADGLFLNSNQSQRALLDNATMFVRFNAQRTPGTRAAEGGVAGKGELCKGRANADAIVGRRLCRRKQEGSLGEVNPRGDGLHLFGV